MPTRMSADDSERRNSTTRLQRSPEEPHGTAVHAGRFYEPYHGHDPDHLEVLVRELRRVDAGGAERRCIFFAGDSSLDNKHWLYPGAHSAWAMEADARHGRFTAPAVNGYEAVLQPPRMVCDVAYWMNRLLAESGQGASTFALNTAVEASLLATRVGGCYACCIPSVCPDLWEQDIVIQNHLRQEDILVISVGGNDIALAPSIFTVAFLLLLMLTPWCLLFPFHPSVLYFSILFHCNFKSYIKKLTSRTKPAKVAACMIYNLDEANVSSWANGALCCLCYTCCPSMLQFRMRYVYQLATRSLSVPGTEVVPVHLAEALDGKDTGDYLQRVEPSSQGGRKMAQLILSKLGLVEYTPAVPYSCPCTVW
eukprot:TRINITY_DN26889_c0_g1_i1.p1 TRINITY_DN26889_c0_g1~~TRINITY_DN26889_c0_g1_i1.p1  ORF type:complete len:366 (+),score=87.89 TRINITY_DN26889_c0_g1_i1:67-1164(+)